MRPPAGAFGVGATFDSGGTFALHALQFATSSTPLRDQLLTGTYVATDATLTITPQQSTRGQPSPITAMPDSVDADQLTFTRGGATPTPETVI